LLINFSSSSLASTQKVAAQHHRVQQMQDVGKFMQMFRVMCAVIDRVENTTEHFAAMVVLVSSNEVSGEGLCIHASVSVSMN
jgi:hypothetical protein